MAERKWQEERPRVAFHKVWPVLVGHKSPMVGMGRNPLGFYSGRPRDGTSVFTNQQKVKGAHLFLKEPR